MPANNIKIKESQYPELREFLSNHSNKEAAKRFGVHEGTIEKICRKISLKKGKPIKHTKDETFFEKIDSHDKAYLLGIMFSDGFVRKNACMGVSLHEKDIEILQFFKDKIRYSGPLRKYNTNPNKNQVVLDICSTKLCKDLSNLGCVVNKSLILKWPTFLENTSFIWSFILGVIDGDGHIQNYDTTVACQITSSATFCEGLKAFLERNNIKSSIHNYENPLTKDVRITSRHAIELFKKVLENQKFSLKRKRVIMEYRLFCAENLMTDKYLLRGTFEKRPLELFSIGKIDECIDFVKSFHKKSYEAQSVKMKNCWVNQFSSAEQKAKTPNPNGQKLQQTHSWGRAVDEILAQIS